MRNYISCMFILLSLIVTTSNIHAQIEEVMKEKLSQFAPTEISYDSQLLNERQIKAVLYAKDNNKISNKEYQSINNVSKRTATNDLTELVEKFKILNKIGTSGAGIYYKLMGH